jgi:hypothetical protein
MTPSNGVAGTWFISTLVCHNLEDRDRNEKYKECVSETKEGRTGYLKGHAFIFKENHCSFAGHRLHIPDQVIVHNGEL